MSLSVLYHFLGINGYYHLRTKTKKGALYLHVVRARDRCGNCRSYDVIYRGSRTRELRTLPIGKKPVFAVVRMRRFYCKRCHKIRFENLHIVDEKKHYTHAMENYVMDLCSVMTVSDVARHTGLHWNTVKEIDKKRLKRNLPKPNDLRGLKYLGIDEVSVKRGHRYLSTVVDLESGRVLHVGEGRRVESVAPFFKRLKLLGIRPMAVALDMWPAFARAVRKYYRGLPLVYDGFHILTEFSRKLNEIRNEEYKKLEGQEKLSLKAQDRLDRLFNVNRPICIAYLLKEDLRRLWKLPSRSQAEKFLNSWISQALSSGVLQLMRFAKKLRRHAAGILNYFDFKISTAKVEGINNRIKVIKRKAYGYTDLDYFMLKIYNIHTTRSSLL